MADAAQVQGPDLTKGIAEADLGEGAMTTGEVNGQAVLVARSGGEVFAIVWRSGCRRAL